MPDLQAPEFARVDPAAIEAELVSRFEAETGKTLYPAQIERLYINQIAYAHSLAMAGIQATGEKMLVRFSSDLVLDYLGDLVGTPRLLASAAHCLIEFTKRDSAAADMVIEAGQRVASSDGRVVFETAQDVELGAVPVRVDAFCTAKGTVGNGWMPGQVATLEGDPEFVATNVTQSSDGADDEKDERYKERIISAPEAYTNAGSYGAYRYHAMAAHQSIVDVAVHGPNEGENPGVVALYPLTDQGLPSAFVLDTVYQAVSGEKVRPLCDTVLVRTPDEVTYQIVADLTFYDTADRVQTLARAQRAIDAYVLERQQLLGADLVPTQISATLHIHGVYRVNMRSPALRVLGSAQWGNCTGITLTDAGVAHG